MSSLSPSKPLSGFQDLLPSEARAFQEAVERMTAVTRRYGYTPIDTPCIFLEKTLAAEGELDKQLYRWKQGSKDVALRFDLTVPLARYVAANENALVFPFKRVHCGKVWRGERPQAGRYREFTQFDFDIVGTDSPTADLETLLVAHDAMVALDIEAFTIRVNDRALLNGVLGGMGLEEQGADVLRVVDKLDKVGEDGVRKELEETVGLKPSEVDAVLGFTRIATEVEGDEEVLNALEARFGDHPLVKLGLRRLRFLREGALAVIPESRLKVDPAIARGLGYYTGPVFETTLDELPGIGSVCSGGRYDDLASAYTKRKLPGVGASVGLSRLLVALKQLGAEAAKGKEIATVILCLPGVSPIEGVRVRAELHAAGLDAELFPQPPEDVDSKATSVKALFKYASQRGFRQAVILGAEELAAGKVKLKDLEAREEVELARDALVAAVRGEG